MTIVPFGSQGRARGGRWLAAGLAAALVMADGPAALAIRPGKWVHDSEDDFAKGQVDQAVVTNLGDIKLAGSTAQLGNLDPQDTIVFDLIQAGPDRLYLAMGPQGKLVVQEGDQTRQILSLTDEQIFCLDLLGPDVVVGISGLGTSRLALLAGDELQTIAELPGARYLWDMVVAGRQIYVATGTEGKLLRVDLTQDPAGVTELFDAAQNNLLCLDRDQAGRLFAGSDGDGLIYRLVPEGDGTASAFVLYDASEPEIAALLVKPDGTVYAGTADARQAKPGRLNRPVKKPEGRPAPAAPAPAAGQPAAKPQQPDSQADPSQGDSDPTNVELPAMPPDDAQTPEDDVQAPSLPAADGNATRPAAPRQLTDPPTGQLPTPEQRDALRQVVRQRLLEARSDGAIQVQPAQAAGPAPPQQASAAPASGRSVPAAAKPSRKGNAVYRIDPDGFVQPVFRESVMVLQLAERNGDLLVATGNEGQLYLVDVQAEETSLLADLQAQQITALQVGNNRTILATSNPAGLLVLDGQYAREGTFTSEVLDAGQISLWGRAHLTATTPHATAVLVETRSGNVENPEQAAWSPWSKAVVLEPDAARSPMAPRELEIASPPARFSQYRLTLESDGNQTAVVKQFQLSYVTPNLRPQVKMLNATYGSKSSKSGRSSSSASAKSSDEPQHEPALRIEWTGLDPNGDTLSYELQYRPDATERWLPLAEELAATRYVWKTQLVADGRYTVRLTASDRPDNTPGMELTVSHHSDPIVIDNTPPQLRNLEDRLADRTVTITAVAADAISPMAGIHFMVDGAEPWQAVLPKDLIYDSTRESFVIVIKDLDPGPHVIAIRLVDERHNTRYEQLVIQVP